ncbi:MAG: thiamine diphosphokinase [Deltaproteobacteria bacterium]|nr:thiamine diphosphokinase [Deltaproteobacteria bacterium]
MEKIPATKMKTIIIANGNFNNSINTEKSLVIAADGGANAAIKAGIKIDVAIGDFDSALPENIKKLTMQGVKLIKYPADKDKTDLELAIRYAVDNNASEILIYGALGKRADMTISNITAASVFGINNKISIIDNNQEITFIFPNKKAEYIGNNKDTISLIPLSYEVCGITATGLEYPLKNETLRFGSTKGVSNKFKKNKAVITTASGILLCVRREEDRKKDTEIQRKIGEERSKRI